MQFPVSIHGEPLATSQRIKAGSAEWYIPEECPVAFVYNRRNYAVMMATPEDLVDFALGFTLTEEIVKSVDEIKSLDAHLSGKGADLRFKISEEALERLDLTLTRRNLVGSASCGLCGLENADRLFKPLSKHKDSIPDFDPGLMVKAMNDMIAHQPLNNQTHSVHAAAWVSGEGTIDMIREDVGRHNALDKLLGAMAADDVDTNQGFVLMSSRSSYEIVEKAARRGVRTILSISGPTSFALRKAEEAHMAIFARAGKGIVRLL